MCFMHCLLILCIFQYGIAKDTLPVFLLDHSQVLGNVFVVPNPFLRTGNIAFLEMINHAVKQSSVLIIFVEEQFCTEDISRKDGMGTPYPSLREDVLKHRVKYMPNVLNPISIITQILEPSQMNVFVLKPGQKFDRAIDKLKFFYVFFKDNKRDETRIEALRRHNFAIDTIYEQIQKQSSGPVVAIYTGKVNPITSTSPRSTPGEKPYADSTIVELASEGGLFRFIGMKLKRPPLARSIVSDMPIIVSELRSKTHTSEFLETYIEFHGFRLRFSFRILPKFWYLDNVTLLEGEEEVGFRNYNIRVPIDQSYYCDEPMTLVSRKDRSMVSITAYQMKPNIPISNEMLAQLQINFDLAIIIEMLESLDMSKLGTFYNVCKCNPYYDIHLLSGFFVSGILLFAIFLSVACLYNLKTNDRMDDAYGKFLIITAEA
ncbi:uncharacterized protein LOC128674753 [Plodia interpunctella]|uniref:uncharacterized protein LOC128674753 n=1 Tax=Plodia interpunctella TaxID=58824 RepID=UPI0023677BD0|nr:uncharacterized protein LOC128674753 [Plodia interpunctella]